MKILKRLFFAAVMVIAVANASDAQGVGVSISARIAPPALPVYVQPACPVDGYLWNPGYWAWNTETQDYYWVPGVWVAPPAVGVLWTPPYWGFEGGGYLFHPGYWGPHIGFYGGINYGFGYYGVGFAGGAWAGNVFRYNRAVVNVNTTVVHNTYIDKTVINNTTVNHTSFNGPNGITAKPSNNEITAMKEDHKDVTDLQQSHLQNAKSDTRQFNASNHGRPTNISMDRVNGHHYYPNGHSFQYHNMGGVRKQ